MEWVETKGQTVEEAKERALDQLGVSEKDVELVVLAEPRTGLFGRVRGEARVRARVRPAEPRPKRARRQRGGQSGGKDAGSGMSQPRARSGRGGPAREEREPGVANRAERLHEGVADQTKVSSGARRRRRRVAGSRAVSERVADGAAEERSGEKLAQERVGVRRANGTTGSSESAKEEHAVADEITLAQQAEVAKEFLEGLLDRYGLHATIETRELDEETVELAAHGEGLGMLVGPKGATVAALQDVTRTVVQKHFPNRTDRILVDVAGYRERRVTALRRFTTQVAAEVLASGTDRALEPMSAADRKVVHDTAVSIEGVTSSSEGEEPRRFVVISPAS